MEELKTVTIISFVFFGMIIGIFIGRSTAPEKVKIIEKETKESMTQAQFLNTIKVCNVFSMSMSNQLRDCRASK